MSSFSLKIIALISMLCDHIGLAFLNSNLFLKIIGRISFPIFAFQISEGYKYTKNINKYFLRLLCFAIISQIPFMFFFSSINQPIFKLNIFFTLILGLLSITFYETIKNKYSNKILSIIPVLFFVTLSQILNCDYGWFGVTIIFLFHIFKENKLMMNISILIVIIMKYLINYIQVPHIYQLYLMIGTASSLLFINLYNNKKGKNIKYLLYIFYPLHLIILALIKMHL